MKMRKLGAISLAAALMATSTAIYAEAAGESLEGTVNLALYVQEDVGWTTEKSDVQAVSKAGSYTFKVTGLNIAKEHMTTFFIKDVDVNDNGATESKINPGTTYKATSIKVNGKDVEIIDGANSIMKNNIFDTNWWNIWDVHHVNLDGIDTIESVEVTIDIIPAPKEDAPAEPEAPAETKPSAETEAPAEETTVEEDDDDVITDDDIDLDTEDDDIDWSGYDEAARDAANQAFVFTKDTSIDIYAAVGDDYDQIATVEATFVWNPEVGWNGGAGIGGGAVFEDGSGWVSGPEYGTVNANDGIGPDGRHTFVVMDLTDNPIAQIASVDEKTGATNFGELQLQAWWNAAEAGAQLESIEFKDADGNVLGGYSYSVDAPAGEPVVIAPAAGDVDGATDSSKGSPDTGVADVAAAAGLAVVAAGAVVVAKKRK